MKFIKKKEHILSSILNYLLNYMKFAQKNKIIIKNHTNFIISVAALYL